MLSIIIPTLNEEDYLPFLLESIKKQGFSDYEIIVSDAGSSDNTLSIAKKHSCKIARGGLPSRGRNEGAKIAKGSIFLFLDADVILPPFFLSQVMVEFEKRNLSIAGFLIFPILGNAIDRFFYFLFRLWLILTQKVLPWSAVAIMAKKGVHDAIGGFNEASMFMEDCYYARRAGKISRYGLIKTSCFTSTRRYEKDGRLMTYLKYILGFCYIIFIGPVTSDMFGYRFGHYKDKR